MKLNLVDIKGNNKDEISLEEKLFGLKPNLDSMVMYTRIYRSNQRQGTQSTKTRGDVSGSGAKPWRQKGTGRARVGQKRSPIWRHGGVAHGPKPRSWTLSLPSKLKELSLRSALSFKALNNLIVVVDKLEFDKPNTKTLLTFLKTISADRKPLLIVDTLDENLMKSSSNIHNLDIVQLSNLNAYSVIFAKKVIFTQSALNKLQEKYENK